MSLAVPSSHNSCGPLPGGLASFPVLPSPAFTWAAMGESEGVRVRVAASVFLHGCQIIAGVGRHIMTTSCPEQFLLEDSLRALIHGLVERAPAKLASRAFYYRSYIGRGFIDTPLKVSPVFIFVVSLLKQVFGALVGFLHVPHKSIESGVSHYLHLYSCIGAHNFSLIGILSLLPAYESLTAQTIRARETVMTLLPW